MKKRGNTKLCLLIFSILALSLLMTSSTVIGRSIEEKPMATPMSTPAPMPMSQSAPMPMPMSQSTPMSASAPMPMPMSGSAPMSA